MKVKLNKAHHIKLCHNQKVNHLVNNQLNKLQIPCWVKKNNIYIFLPSFPNFSLHMTSCNAFYELSFDKLSTKNFFSSENLNLRRSTYQQRKYMFAYRSNGKFPGNRWIKYSLSYSLWHQDLFCYSCYRIVHLIPNAQL